MSKLIFTPFSILAGLLAGIIGKRLFRGLWGAVDDQEPPKPEQRVGALPKLAFALALEGALSRLAKGLAAHGSRHVFARFTGSWPGEAPPEKK